MIKIPVMLLPRKWFRVVRGSVCLSLWLGGIQGKNFRWASERFINKSSSSSFDCPLSGVRADVPPSSMYHRQTMRSRAPHVRFIHRTKASLRRWYCSCAYTVAYKRQAAANLHPSLTDKYSLQPATVIIIIIIIILYIS